MSDNDPTAPRPAPAPEQTADHAPEPGTAGPDAVRVTESFDPHRTTGLDPAGPSPGAEGVPGYELLGELGRGGMGVVYEARDTRLNRTVALKMILGRPSAAERMRFRAEAEAMAAVRHPNVAQVFEAGEANGRPFLAMELLSIGTFADHLKANRLRDPEAVAGVVRKVAAGVAAAHALGIVHRDLKPGNVLFDESGEPKVTDFGLAKRDAGGDLTATGAVMGTPAYMAPEQADGNTKFVGPAADVWSLGVILYEALTGVRPFAAPDARGLLAQVLTADPAPLRKLAPSVPRDLELICLKCLSKAPHERYPTAKELAGDLDRFLGGGPVSVRPMGGAERAVRWVRRHPAQAGLWAAVAVAAVALVGVGVALAYRGKLETAYGVLASVNLSLEAANGELTTARDQLQRDKLSLASANRDLTDARTELAKALAREQKARYFNRVSLAFVAWQRGDFEAARRHLAECPEEFRGWEWDYVARLLAPERAGIATGRVGPLAVSPDGRTLAGAAAGNALKLWDLATSEEKFVLKGHAAGIGHVVFSGDGKYLATAGADKSVKVWEAATGKNLCTLTGHKDNVWSVAFSADGTRLATGDDTGVQVWDAATGKRLAKLNQGGVSTGSVLAVAFNPGGTRIHAALGSSMKVWDLAKPDDHFNAIDLPGPARVLTFAPDGRLVLGLHNGSVQFWDRSDPRKPPVTVKTHEVPISGLVFSRDGKRFGTTALDGTVKVWDATTYQELAGVKLTFGGAPPPPQPGRPAPPPGAFLGPPPAFTPDLYRVISAHADGSVKVWPVTNDPAAALSISAGSISHVAFNADGTRFGAAVAGLDDDEVRVWDTATGRMAFQLQEKDEPPEGFERPLLIGPIRHFAFDPTGARVATAHAGAWSKDPFGREPDIDPHSGKLVQVWDTATKKKLHVLKGHAAGVANVAFSADGARIASASTDGVVKVWNAADGKLLATFATNKDKFAVAAFSRDARRFACGMEDGTVRVWDVELGKELVSFKAHAGRVSAVAFGADGARLVTAGADRTVRVWDAAGRELVKCAHPTAAGPMALSPDGTRIATGGGLGEVTLWDATTGQVAFSAPGDKSASNLAAISGLAFSPDGTRLLIGGATTVRVWDARPPAEPKR